MKKAVIIIPTYNEAHNIKQLIEAIFDETKSIQNWDISVLIVDSSSPDKTDVVVENLQKTYKNLLLLTTKERGLGKAYVLGMQYSLDNLKPFIIFEMDADLSHNPKKIPQFLNSIEKGADFVIGSRYMKGGSIPKDWGIHRKLFSILGNFIIRFGFMKLRVTDWTSGFRAIKSWIIKDALSHIDKYSGYVFQIAILDFALKNKAVIKEIPIQFKDRESGESKISFSGYITQIFLYIFQHSSFIKFVIVGGIGFILDFGLSFIFIEKLHYPIWFATLISTETAIISNFFLNNFWSFSHKQIENRKRSYAFNLIKFNLVSSGSILLQTITIQTLSHLFGRKLWFIYKIMVILFLIIPYSYILYNKFIWKDKNT